METRYLEEIGLTKGEIQVYLSLLHLGQTTSGPIIAESRISSSKVYEIIEKLLRKGLVSYIIKNKTKYFQATSPAKIRDYMSVQERRLLVQKNELESHLPALMELFLEHHIKQNAELFTGNLAIKTMLWDMIEDGKKGDSYLFFGGVGEKYEEAVERLYLAYASYRYEKGLEVRGIAPELSRKILQPKKKYLLRFIDFSTPSNMTIFKDRVAIISWSDSPIAILITSESIANQFRDFFENIWKIAKK